MFSLPGRRKLSRQIDRIVLAMLSHGMPDSLDQEQIDSPPLVEMVEQTTVKRQKTNLYNLVAPGEHGIWLDTPLGEIRCSVKVRLAILPSAPLLLYHHGFAEIPYTATWSRIMPSSQPFPAHAVAVQAPFHDGISDPLNTGFSSVKHIYQMFAGSLRVYELMRERFEENGAAYTVTSGLSWGGITSLLYEAMFGQARATVPLFASPNLAQVMVDGSQLIGRPLPVEREVLDSYFDFTSIVNGNGEGRIFPVLGEDDLFFRFDEHAVLYAPENLRTVKGAHVGAAYYLRQQLRGHLLEVLEWAAEHPREM